MKKKLLMLSVFALATTAMASATLKEEVSYNFEGTPGSVNVLKSDGTKKMEEDGTTEVKEHPLDESHTPKAVTSLNIDTDLVKADLAFQLDRNFKYTNETVSQLGETDKYRNVKNLDDKHTKHDMYGDAELTYKINDNLTAKGFLHYNENHKIKSDDPIHAAVKIGLDYNYAGVSGRGLLMSIKPFESPIITAGDGKINENYLKIKSKVKIEGLEDKNVWNGFKLTAKTNIDKFELTGDALGLFDFSFSGIQDNKKDNMDLKSILFPPFYSELNLGAKYVNGALTSDNKLHYHSFVYTNMLATNISKENDKKDTLKNSVLVMPEIKQFWDGNDKVAPLDLKLTSDNTYKFNDKVTLTGNAKLEHKMKGYLVATSSDTNNKELNSQLFIKEADYIIEAKPGVKYEDQMGALKLTATGDSKISYDYNRGVFTIKGDKLKYIAYSDKHTIKAKPGAEAKVEYKINDELKATGHVGLGTDLEYIKENLYDVITDNTKAEYNGDNLTSIKGIKPSLGAGLEYMNGSLTASVKANVSNVDTFTTTSTHDKDGKVLSKTVKREYKLDNKGTNVDLKADYKVNDQISAGAEASVNISFANTSSNSYDKDDKQVSKGDEVTTFQLIDNGLDGDKKAQTFFSVYGSYKPMSSLTTTATAKVELATTTENKTIYDNDKEDFPVLKTTKTSSIDLLKPSFELKADYTILKGLKLGAKTSIGAKFGNGHFEIVENNKTHENEKTFVPGAYVHTSDKDGNETYNNKKVTDLTDTEKKDYEKAVKDGNEIKFNKLTYSLGLTLSYEW